MLSDQFIIERNVVIRKCGEIDRVGVIRIVCDPTTEPPECRFTIPGIDEKERTSHGEDMLQAIWLCLRYIRTQIHTWSEAGTDLWWAEPGDHCLLD